MPPSLPPSIFPVKNNGLCLQKPIVKSTFSGNFCKRLNTFDDFWGCRFVWHPEDTKSGPPPGVVGQSGTLRTPKVVPHLGWFGHLAP